MRKRITTIGNSAAIVLSKDVLSIMGVEAGDEVEMTFIDRTLVVRPVDQAETDQKIDKAIKEVFSKHHGLMKRLAK